MFCEPINFLGIVYYNGYLFFYEEHFFINFVDFNELH